MSTSTQGEIWLKVPFSLTPKVLTLSLPGPTIQLEDVVDVTGVGSEFALNTSDGSYALCADSQDEALALKTALEANVASARDVAPTPLAPVGRLQSGHSEKGADVVKVLSEFCPAAGEVLIEGVQALLAAPVRPKHPESYMISQLNNLISSKAEGKTNPYERAPWHWSMFALEKVVDRRHHARLGKELPAIAADMKEGLLSFVPDVLVKAILAGKVKGEMVDLSPGAEMRNPIIETVKGVVVFADASGFTALSNKLTTVPHGGEKLGMFLNDFFTHSINIIKRWGGDILKFSGDAVTILFPIESPEQELLAPLLASCCCQELHTKLSGFPTPAGGVFNYHIGIGYGDCTLMEVGGLHNRFEFCVMGPPISQISVAEPAAPTKRTCGSPEFLARYGEACIHFKVSREKEEESGVPGYMVLGDIADIESFTIAPPPEALPDCDLRILRKYIPASAFRKLLLQSTTNCRTTFPGEMRKVTAVFLKFAFFDPGPTTPEGAKKLQLLVTCCQRSCYAMEGSMNKFMMDDKGMQVLIIFGLPPFSHFADDSVRAIITAKAMLQSIKAQGVVGSVGISTGNAWCGFLGSPSRREYAVMGNVVNLAARFAAHAPADGLLFGHETAKDCELIGLEVLALEPVMLKGMSASVPIFQPTGRLLRHLWFLRHPKVTTRSHRRFWMASPPAKKLQNCVSEQLRQGGGIVVITGRPGTGKTDVADCLHIWKDGIVWNPTESTPTVQARDRATTEVGATFRFIRGNSLNVMKTHLVAMKAWGEICSQLGQCILRDPDLMDEARAISGLPSPNLMQTLQSLLSEESVNFLPILAELMSSLEVRHSSLEGALDFDERHTSFRLCKILCEVIDLVRRREHLVVLLHVQGSSGFLDDPDPRSFQIAEKLCEHAMSMRRGASGASDASPGAGSFVLVVCASSEGACLRPQEFQIVKDRAAHLGALIETKEFDQEESAEYICLCFRLLKAMPLTCILPEGLSDFIMNMTGGNAGLVETMAHGFWQTGIATLEDDDAVVGSVVLRAPGGDDAPALGDYMHTPDFVYKHCPGIMNVAFAYYDRLDEGEQATVRLIASTELEVWSLEQMILIDPSSLFDVGWGNLEEKRWVKQVDPKLLADPSVKCFTWYATFLRLAAEHVVLHERVLTMRQKKKAVGISDIELTVPGLPGRRRSTEHGR